MNLASLWGCEPVSKNAWYGCRRDTKDARDHMFKPKAVRLPKTVDLRAHCPPVMDQGQLGSCTAHGITGALRYELLKRGQPDAMLSRLQLYYDERAAEGTIKSDAGAEIRDGIKCAAKIGVGHEALWPYAIGKFASKPPAAVYSDALKFKALTYQRVEVSASAVKHALAEGHPVIIGITVYEEFESDDVASTGVVPMPTKKSKPVGGHCVLVTGYGQRQGYFTIQNSWGASWGDQGFCYLPESYVGSKLFGSDFWTIQSEGGA